MENNLTLFQLTSDLVELEDILVANGGELTPEIEEMMNQTTTALTAKVDGYGKLCRKFESMADAADAEIKRLQQLKKVAQKSEESLKNHLLFVMQNQNIAKLDGTLTKVSRRKSSALNVDEEVFLEPIYEGFAKFVRTLPIGVTAQLKVNKTEIKDAYKGTAILPAGCYFVENESLIMR